MCSISVDPIPSMIAIPVASRNACHVAAGRCSPADTACRRVGSEAPAASIALYAVGAVEQIVTPCSVIRVASSAGVAFSTRSVEAPACSGKSSTAPSPNVNANGGVPVNTSSGVGRSTWRENVSHTASTSRCRCIVAFGRPVVPDVNASRATSSHEVATSSKVVGFDVTRWVRSSGASPPYAIVGSAQPCSRVEEAMVDECHVERRDLVDRRQLARAQQRHRRDDHRHRP